MTRTGRYKRWMVLGLGLGATRQNLVLAVQNTVGQSDLGVASSTVAFFRSLGGAIGVSVLGALLGHQLASEGASADAFAHIFGVAAPFALLALIAIVAMTEVPLRRTLDLEPADDE